MRVGVNRHQSTNRRGWNEKGKRPIPLSERQPGNFGLTNRCRRLHHDNYPDKQQCELFHLFVIAYFLGLLGYCTGGVRSDPFTTLRDGFSDLIYVSVQTMKFFPCWTSRWSVSTLTPDVSYFIILSFETQQYFKLLFHKLFLNQSEECLQKQKRHFCHF